ncbi:MAG: acyl-[acyl-carrier-protein] thioesterase [Lactobacillaceae bacterium]
MKVFRQQFRIPFFDCDQLSRMKPTAIIDRMILVSFRQLADLGFDEKWMAQKKQGWVVTQYDLNIERTPKEEEEIIVSTWIENYNKFFSYRNFAFDTLDGKRLVTLKSVWVTLNLESRKLCVLNPEMMEKLAEPSNVVIRTPKIKIDEKKLQNKQNFAIRFEDIDTNQHITNTSYIKWMIESLGINFLQNHELKKFQIRFEKEIQELDFIQASYYRETTGSQIKFYHQIAQGSKVACQSMSLWD